jgi:hypothetical protein
MADTRVTVMFTMALVWSMHSRTFLVNQNPSHSLPAAVFRCLWWLNRATFCFELSCTWHTLETGHHLAFSWQTVRMGVTNVDPLTVDGEYSYGLHFSSIFFTRFVYKRSPKDWVGPKVILLKDPKSILLKVSFIESFHWKLKVFIERSIYWKSFYWKLKVRKLAQHFSRRPAEKTI